jgi:hypothetical protein
VSTRFEALSWARDSRIAIADCASLKKQKGHLNRAERISGEPFSTAWHLLSVPALGILIRCHADAGSSIKEKEKMPWRAKMLAV